MIDSTFHIFEHKELDMNVSKGFVATCLVAVALLAIPSVRGQVGPGLAPQPVQPPPVDVPSPAIRAVGPGGAANSGSSSLRSQDYEFGRQAESLAAQYGAAKEDADKEKVRAKLRDVLDKQFEVHHQRREEELAKLEARVRSLRELLTKRKDQRQSIVDRRLEQLLRDAEGLGWSGPSTGGSSSGGQIVGAPSAFLYPEPNGYTAPAAGLPPATPRSPVPYRRAQ
jgi:hypothetical protein